MTSQITSQLKSRIEINKKFGTVDLDEWIFSKFDIKDSYAVLDLGCGTGNHIIKLAELFSNANYYGIDISNSSIIEAKKKAEQKNLKINFICGDAFDVSKLENNFFDLIISLYALYYIKDTQKILSVLKARLKKDGKIAVMAPYRGNNEEWYSILRTFMKIPDDIESVADNFMDNEVLPFARSNFKNVKIYNFVNKVLVPSYDDLKKYWVSNIYHKEEFDTDFEKKASEFFKKNKYFAITKIGMMVIMSIK